MDEELLREKLLTLAQPNVSRLKPLIMNLMALRLGSLAILRQRPKKLIGSVSSKSRYLSILLTVYNLSKRSSCSSA